MQQALNRSYSDRDKIVSDLDKLREDLERSQVRTEICLSFRSRFDYFGSFLGLIV